MTSPPGPAAAEIARRLGGIRSGSGWLVRCPVPTHGRGRGDRRPSLSIADGADGRLLAHCHAGCAASDVLAALGVLPPPRAARRPMPRPPAPSELDERRGRAADRAAEIWRSSEKIADGTPAATYLARRGCALPPVDGALRWRPRNRHPRSGYVGPALIAAVTDAISGELLTVHMTWLAAGGRAKAPVDRPRLLQAGGRKAGGVIRLWPIGEDDRHLAVGEGIETALALAWRWRPVWSTIDAGGLAALPVIDGIATLIIAIDRDPGGAGQRAAAAAAARWRAAGREVLAVLPPDVGMDVADIAAGGGRG